MVGSPLSFSSQDVGTKSNDLSSGLSAQKNSTSEAWRFYGVIECERHHSFHRIDDTSWAQTNCLFEKVMKYLLSIAVQISSSNWLRQRSMHKYVRVL